MGSPSSSTSGTSSYLTLLAETEPRGVLLRTMGLTVLLVLSGEVSLASLSESSSAARFPLPLPLPLPLTLPLEAGVLGASAAEEARPWALLPRGVEVVELGPAMALPVSSARRSLNSLRMRLDQC